MVRGAVPQDHRRHPGAGLTALLVVLLVAPAMADLAADVRRCFRYADPSERSGGLAAMRAGIGEADVRERNAAAAVVEKALKSEPSPSVRATALDFLLELRTERSFDRLVAGALDADEGVRTHVHAIVRDHADPLLHAAIVRALREDASWRMRASMVDLLLSGGRASARRPLVAVLDDAHPAVAARAAEVLERLTGMAFGVDRPMWETYFAGLAEEEARREGETRTVADEHRKVELKKGPIAGLAPTLYTVPVREKRVIFVVDMSSSMHQAVRSGHFGELKQALFGLASDVEFNILCFDQRLFFYTEAKSLVPATVDEKVAAERWLDTLPAGDRTDVNRSVAAGLAMLKEALAREPDVRGELFILTDGRETISSMPPEGVEAQFAKLPVGRCRVHVIALGRHGTTALRRIAERSGGRYVEVPSR